MTKKAFFYTGKDYMNATYTERYTRESRWVKVQYTLTDEARPYIRHDNRRLYLDDFMRAGVGGYPFEITAKDGEAVTLAGFQSDVYYKPFFVEIDEAGEAARLYRYEGTEERA